MKFLFTNHERLYFRYFEDFEKKIPRGEIQEIEYLIKRALNDLDPEFTITICGSYRFLVKITYHTCLKMECGISLATFGRLVFRTS